MGYREIVSEARQLPLHDQLRLVEELLRGIRTSRIGITSKRRQKVKPFTELRGFLKPEGPLPTDEELDDAYTQHLIEKYL